MIPGNASAIKFGTDGWRAAIADEYTFDNVRICAQAVANEMAGSDTTSDGLLVAFDTRYASDRFAAAVAEVAAANGIGVRLASVPVPTPAASFAVTHFEAGAGVVITASHNPGADNGFKVKSAQGGSASPDIIARIEVQIAAILKGDSAVRRMSLTDGTDSGLIKRFDISEQYLEQVRGLVDLKSIQGSGLKIVVDAMFGAGGGFMPRVLNGGNLDLMELNGDPNPAFPGIVQPEPIASNLEKLARSVRETGADVGIALDGDADRVGIIDETGRFMSTLETYSMLAHHMLRGRGERGAIVSTTTMSSMIDRLGDHYGVDVARTPVGFKYVGPKMLELDAMMGGEESGGYAFKGHVPERDGILSGLLFLEAMVAAKRMPSELLTDLHDIVGPHTFRRVDLQFPEADRDAIKARCDAATPASLGGVALDEIDRRDGAWFRLNGGSWAVVRFSGTEPLLRTYAEAPVEATLDAIIADVRALVGV